MKIHSSITLPNNIKFLIIEIDNFQIEKFFDKRFQLAVEINGKRIFPKYVRKFLQFTNKGYLYTLNSDKYNGEITLDTISYNKLQLCNKSLEDCNCEILSYMSMYNLGVDLNKTLKETYKF